MLYLVCPGINAGKNKVMWFYYEVIVVTISADYANSNSIGSLSGDDLEGKSFRQSWSHD